MTLAPLSAIAVPPVLYSFPSEIKIASAEERHIFGLKHGCNGEAVPSWIEARWENGQFQINLGGWLPAIPMQHDTFVALTEDGEKRYADDHYGSAR